MGKEALARRDFKAFEPPTRFVLGKSLVGGTIAGDIFERVTAGPIAFVRPPGPSPQQTRHGVSLELGGPWHFYHEFWRAHALDRMADLLPVPEISNRSDESIGIPLIIRNDTDSGQNVTVSSVLPHRWVDRAQYSTFPLLANGAYPVGRSLSHPMGVTAGWYEVTWKAEAAGGQTEQVVLRVYVN